MDFEGVGTRRMRGYLGAFEAAGIALPDAASVVAPATIEGGIAALRRAWEDGLRPTGVLVMSDAMAIGVIRAARELGLRVPQDLSVVGFDDIDISQHTNPPLTTVHQPIRLKGETAVRLLLAMIEGRDQRPRGGAPGDAPDHPRVHRPGAPRCGARPMTRARDANHHVRRGTPKPHQRGGVPTARKESMHES